jgi:2,4-dienoyl-CoA reductase-like NADH-dependent reductase (Old Yellow Enzyme family)
MATPDTALGEMKYPHLFSSGTIGTLAVANRFVRSATAEDLVL